MLTPAANRVGVKRQRRQRQKAAVGPARAGDAPRVGQAVVDQETRAVGDVVDGAEPLFLVVGVDECAAETAGAADIRRQHADPVVDQAGEDLAVAGPGLALRTTVQVDNRAPGPFPAADRYSHAFRLNPSRAVIVSGAVAAENPGMTGPRLGSRSIGSH